MAGAKSFSALVSWLQTPKGTSFARACVVALIPISVSAGSAIVSFAVKMNDELHQVHELMLSGAAFNDLVLKPKLHEFDQHFERLDQTVDSMNSRVSDLDKSIAVLQTENTMRDRNGRQSNR